MNLTGGTRVPAGPLVRGARARRGNLFSFSNIRYKRKGDSCLGLNPKKQCISWEGTSQKRGIPQASTWSATYEEERGVNERRAFAVSRQPGAPLSEPLSFIPVKGVDDAGLLLPAGWNPGIYGSLSLRSGYRDGVLQSRSPGHQTHSPTERAPPPRPGWRRRTGKVRENPRDTQSCGWPLLLSRWASRSQWPCLGMAWP